MLGPLAFRAIALAVGSALGAAMVVGGAPQRGDDVEQLRAELRSEIDDLRRSVRETDRLLIQLGETNQHNIMLTEAKVCDVVRDLNANLAAMTDGDHLGRLAEEQRVLCRQMYERAAEFRGSRPYIQRVDVLEEPR